MDPFPRSRPAFTAHENLHCWVQFYEGINELCFASSNLSTLNSLHEICQDRFPALIIISCFRIPFSILFALRRVECVQASTVAQDELPVLSQGLQFLTSP